ncbi:hypothetical protein A5621_18435 [Mycobacterium colombiense]|uniref:Uncharacterized protein n=1 Tax=Mycobacterium colombiense TaxID=339268 RepID=A0A853LV84_9MYCO|nr:hypothetical protein [Mycobacterium colombiense]OBJ09236.1 hypothetical protein A5623_27895 [Mycobacterium colombiense]OBJ21933.1 hypothetical protein A9W93_13650 [Mycobacterium colombiense]OBJ34838.1 hypothetical protein A5621_18435 [Mycobacterium colombiense]OBJ35010.1 hypothetical protein A5620_21890 [Mycobacterium colombiense]OBJ57662.1 hypothetical protein A5628_16580 [Mycobacterium colombiense]
MRPTICVAAAAVAVVTAACGGSPYAGISTTTGGNHTDTPTTIASQPATAVAVAYLRSLIPTPATTNRADGPDPIHDGGIRSHFFVNGPPADVMSAYKAALLSMNWTLIVDSAGGGPGGGGATYTARNGNAFGVFKGGAFGSATDIDACAWPSAPPDKDCARRG